MAIRNVKLTIAYDGSDYRGWQIQPGLTTVQGVLTEAVRSLLGPDLRVCGASRTDSGVHALGQTALIEIDSPVPTANLPRALTDRLPNDIAVVAAEDVPMGFDVIGDVTNKLYRYTIYCSPTRPVLHGRYCWHLPTTMDAAAMDTAAKHLVGKNDFKSFASAADNRTDSVRTIFRCDVTAKIEDGVQWVYTEVEGDGFLYNMVRNIVGSLVEVGIGRWQPERMAQALGAKDRTAAGPIAPPNGLCLMWIEYGQDTGGQ